MNAQVLQSNQPKKVRLSKVSIGPWISSRNSITTVNVNYNAIEGRANGLKDENMGYVRKKGEFRANSNFAQSIGKMGVISFNQELLNPIMRDSMLMYLSVYTFDTVGNILVMKDDLLPLVKKHKTYEGFRRLKHISSDASKTNPWKKNGQSLASIVWQPSTTTAKIDVSGSALRKLLTEATANYRRGGLKDSPVTIEDLGINLAISKPEDYVRGDVPVLPNIFRAGNAYQKKHAYDTLYEAIIKAKSGGDKEAFSTAIIDLVKKSKEANLVGDVFSAKKTGFIRGSMYSKVGGQIGRSVVAPNPSRRPDEIGIPQSMAKEISRRMILTRSDQMGLEEVRRLVAEGKITHIFDDGSKEFVRIQKEHISSLGSKNALMLRELQDGDICLGNRQPSLHRNSMLGFTIYTHEYKCIFIHPSSAKGFAAD